MPSTPYRYRRSRLDMNRGSIFQDTTGVAPSAPLHQGAYNRSEEEERLRSSYSMFHGPKVRFHDRRADIVVKPSSYRLLAGTNEFAEDLTGQRQPLNAWNWKSETQSNFDGKVQIRPRSAPAHRIISDMNNEEPLFRKTVDDKGRRAVELNCLNPHQGLPPSRFRERDMYQSTYSLQHRPFGREEQMSAAFWTKERRSRPWLEEPVTAGQTAARVAGFSLDVREPVAPADNKIYPTEAQVSTLPHYTNPLVRLGRSENQVSFGNPYEAPEFYHEEPNRPGSKPMAVHLQKTFVN